MTWIMLSLLGFALGLAIGNVYQNWKARMVEFQEIILLKAAKLRAERARYEADEEHYRSEINELLDRRSR